MFCNKKWCLLILGCSIATFSACKQASVTPSEVKTSPPSATPPASTANTPNSAAKLVTLHIDHKIARTPFQVEVANSPQELTVGLMNRDSMPENQGMLFVFDQPRQQCFWMKNTRIPLSIAFLNTQHEIVHITDMQPQTTQEHCADNAMYTIEMNQGWFARHHVQVGQKVLGITQKFEP